MYAHAAQLYAKGILGRMKPGPRMHMLSRCVGRMCSCSAQECYAAVQHK